MIRITIVSNPFEPQNGRILKEVPWEGKRICDYLPPFNEPVVHVNQKRAFDLEAIVPDGAEIVVSPRQEVSAVAGFIYTAFTGAAISTTIAGLTAGMIVSYVAAAAIVMAGSMLISSMLAPQAPNSSLQSIESSPTYSWNPAQTLPRAGSPLPVLYGTHKLTGNIMQKRIEYEGDDEYLYLQLALCMGEIEDITAENILINNAPILSYDNVEWFFRNGTQTQEVMPYFGDIESPNSFTHEFENTSPATRRTVGNSAEALRLFVQFPNGIYYSNDKGGLDTRTVTFRVEYKKTSDSAWKNHGNFSYSAAKNTAINRAILIDNLDSGEYDVRVTRLTAVSTNVREVTKAIWGGMGEIIKDDLFYPHTALFGVKIKASGQLSGGVDVSIVATRKPIEVFNASGVSQGLKSLTNPAWVYWDMLTNPVYGEGMEYSQVDFHTIAEWATWCDEMVSNGLAGQEKRATFNGVFDFEGNLWDALLKPCTIGRASPFIKGTKYSVVVDKPAPMVQIFNMGNIVENSLKISYIGDEDLATEVEVQFVNKDNDYTNDTLSVVVPEWFNTDKLAKKTTIQQMGITNASQAYRAGRYFLANNKHIKRTTEFEAGIDAIDSEVGDVIGVSHDVPAWGESGRLESATTTTLTIDKEVTLVSGREYTITVRLLDNTIEKRDVVFSSTHPTKNITVSSPFSSAPQAYDIYSLVEKPFGIKLFRIVSISRKKDQTRKIMAVEYNESILTDSTTIVPTSNPSQMRTYPSAYFLRVEERSEVKKDGTVIPFVSLSWDVDSFAYSNIYISKDMGNSYELIAQDLRQTSFEYNALELEVNKGYWFKVACKGLNGDYQGLAQSTGTYHVFLGTNNAIEVSTQDRLEQLLYDSGFLQKALSDGLVTIYTGSDEPVGAHFYDLWKVNVNEVRVKHFTFSSYEIRDYTLGDEENIYLYYNERGEWVVCTPSQVSFIDGVLKQLSVEALADGKARVFTTEPYAPYDVGDMWIQDGGDILFSSVDREAGYDATDWGIKPKYTDDTVATQAKDEATQAKGWAAQASKFIVDPTTGAVTGWGFADGTGMQSTFRINSDVFTIANSADQTQALFENGAFRTYDLQGNFSQLNAGSLEFYKASDPNTAYKYLKFIQSGTVENGEIVTLHGFDKLPAVMVSTADIMIYNKDFGAQSQALKTYPAELKMVGGVVTFKPTAKLVVAGASNIASLDDWSYSNSGTISSSSKVTPPNTKKIEVSLNVNSIRSTGTSGAWYRRTSSLQMQLYNGSVWYNVGSAVTVSHTDLTQNNVVVSSGAITPSTHTYRIVATFSDTGGTFNAPIDWVYFTETASAPDIQLLTHREGWTGGESDVRTVTLSYSLKNGEELVSSSYSVEMEFVSENSTTYSSRTAYSRGSTVVWQKTSSTNIDHLGVGYKKFTYTGLSTLSETTSVFVTTNNVTNGKARLDVRVKNRVLTLNLRKPSASLSTTATNTIGGAMASFELSEEEELASGFVNYIAIG